MWSRSRKQERRLHHRLHTTPNFKTWIFQALQRWQELNLSLSSLILILDITTLEFQHYYHSRIHKHSKQLFLTITKHPHHSILDITTLKHQLYYNLPFLDPHALETVILSHLPNSHTIPILILPFSEHQHHYHSWLPALLPALFPHTHTHPTVILNHQHYYPSQNTHTLETAILDHRSNISTTPIHEITILRYQQYPHSQPFTQQIAILNHLSNTSIVTYSAFTYTTNSYPWLQTHILIADYWQHYQFQTQLSPFT